MVGARHRGVAAPAVRLGAVTAVRVAPLAKAPPTGDSAFSRFFFRLTHPRLIFAGLAILMLLVALLDSVDYPWGLRLSGDIAARSVTFQVGDPNGLDIDGDFAFNKAGLSVREARHIAYPGRNIGPAARDGNLDLHSDGVSLTHLRLGHGGRMTITRQGGALEWDLSGADGSIGIEAPDPKAAGASMIVAVTIDKNDAVPVVLRGDLLEPFSIDDAGVESLRFGQRRTGTGTDRPFLSSVTAGHLTIDQSGQAHELGAGMPIAMRDFKGTLVRLQTGPEGVHLWFNGRGSKVTLGTLGEPKDVTPSLFDVLGHQQPLAFLWAAVVAVLALLGNFMQWHNWRQGK